MTGTDYLGLGLAVLLATPALVSLGGLAVAGLFVWRVTDGGEG